MGEENWGNVLIHVKFPQPIAICDAVQDRLNKERKLRELWDDVF